MPYAEGLENENFVEKESLKTPGGVKNESETPKKKKKNILKWFLIIYLGIAALLFLAGYFQTIKKEKEMKSKVNPSEVIIMPLSNEDMVKEEIEEEWLFNQQSNYNSSPSIQPNIAPIRPPCDFKCEVESFFERNTLQQISVAMIISLIFVLFLLSDTYLLYRFYGFLIRRFKKDKTFGDNKQLMKALIFFFIGLFLFIYGILIVNAGFNHKFLEGPFRISFNVLTFVFSLYIPVAILYFIYSFIVWLIKKKRKKLDFSLRRRFLYSFTLVSYVYFIYAFVFYPANILTSTYGTSVSYNTSISSSSPIPNQLGSPGGNIGSLKSAPNMGARPNTNFAPMADMAPPVGGGLAEENIGFSTGGAKDINNFRENIKNGYLPLPTDVTYEGLFYDYYFNTGQVEECNELFCPSYSYANTADPFSGKFEEYISVGLNSGIKESDFQRKKLNLVIVMDISGSMSSPFYQYYYDNPGEHDQEDYDNRSKMQVANESVVSLLSHLNADDNFGMVLFDNQGYLAKPMKLVGDTDMKSIKEHILEIRPQGGTNMEAGLRIGTELLEEYEATNLDEYENRIIFITDAQPNTGVTNRNGLLGMTESNAENNINTTFIGVGVDFNTELIEHITKIRGSNYYSVHSSGEFEKRMDDGFEYMVTPLVFDLSLEVDSDDYEIEKVYGSPEADEATGQIMYVNTLFPSDSSGGEVKGGIVLIKLKKLSDSPSKNIKLYAKYEDRNGEKHNNEVSVNLPSYDLEQFDNDGIQKAILLSRYANLLKNWTIDERSKVNHTLVNYDDGIILPDIPMLSEWERTSIQLKVNSSYEKYFREFKEYFVSEMSILNDEDLKQEVDVIDLILKISNNR